MKKKGKKEIQKENVELRRRIEQEFGGKSGSSSDTIPELENDFLKYIIAFEEQFAEGKQTTVYRYIGQPAWIPAHQLTDAQITTALHLVQSILAHHAVRLNTLCSVDNRTLYRFITEELFDQEMMIIRIPGTWTNFIYEDFHPNHEYDSEQAALDFIRDILLTNADTEDWYFNESLKLSLSPELGTEKVVMKVKNFINSWSDIAIQHFNIISVEVMDDDQEAMVTFEIAYDATMEDSSQKVIFEGNGKINLENVLKRLECTGWEVRECDMPGFEL